MYGRKESPYVNSTKIILIANIIHYRYNLYRLCKVKKPDQKQIELKQTIANANEKRKRLEAEYQNLEHQKKFLLGILDDKLKSCSIQEQLQTREALGKMMAEDEKSKAGF